MFQEPPAFAEIAGAFDVSEAASSLPPHFAEPDWIAEAADVRHWRWARIMWARAANQDGAFFDAAKAEAMVEIWPKIFRLTTGVFGGHEFILADWQKIIVRMLFGWRGLRSIMNPKTRMLEKREARIFRSLRLWMPRKGGKSEFLAALGLMFWLLEGQYGGEGYCFAFDRTQADIVFGKMKKMIRLNPALRRQLEPWSGHIYEPTQQMTFLRLTGSKGGKHGTNPFVVIGDEMHEWASRDIEVTLRQGMGAQLEPIELFGSTAGLKDNPVGVELYEESKAILEGEIEDDTTLVAIFAADEDDDPYDPATWAKANPNLGIAPLDLKVEVAKSRISPNAEAWFKCYHLGVWADAETAWLAPRHWNACAGAGDWKGRHNRPEWAKRPALAGVDLSSTKDFTALVWRLKPLKEGDPVQIAVRLWLPEDRLREREKTSRWPFRRWYDQGAIEICPGNAIEHSFIRKAILEGYEHFSVDRIGFDAWNAQQMMNDLVSSGIPLERLLKVIQGIISMGAGSKQFERKILTQQIDHGGHPVLAWMARHCTVRLDENLNFMPAKRRSAENIDGLVASVIAECLSIEAAPETSVYNTRGAVIL